MATELKASAFRFGLPLLAKDLIEQSALKRTYVLRVLYALIIYGLALVEYSRITGGIGSEVLVTLGRGRELFQMLVASQFYAIMLLMPALTCGAITSEKERDTLGLLLLTKLHPLTIVLEKFLGRLVAMGTYQLITIPLFAVVYGMGGVEVEEIVLAIWSLFLLGGVVGAWGILCSTWHSSTAGAFLSSYAVIPLVMCLCGGLFSPMAIQNQGIMGFQQSTSSLPAGFEIIFRALYVAAIMTAMSINVIIVLVVILVSARYTLVDRAFIPPKNLLLEFFKQIDKFFEELNQSTTRGLVLVRDNDFGPVFDPIAWRETRKKSLGTVRYLFRLLVLLETPLLISISFVISDPRNVSFDGPTTFFLTVLWPISVVAVTVHTTSVLASERSRQTLDILLVTPISQQYFVLQKLAGVRRLLGVLAVPFVTMILFHVIWAIYVNRGLNVIQDANMPSVILSRTAIIVLSMICSTLIYLPLIQWTAFRIALRLRNQVQAVLTTIGLVVALCIAPMLVAGPLAPWPKLQSVVVWLSPVNVILVGKHIGDIDPYGIVLQSISPQSIKVIISHLGIHFALATVAYFYMRISALNEFSRLVGRTEPARSQSHVALTK